jgi:hypothetical protein
VRARRCGSSTAAAEPHAATADSVALCTNNSGLECSADEVLVFVARRRRRLEDLAEALGPAMMRRHELDWLDLPAVERLVDGPAGPRVENLPDRSMIVRTGGVTGRLLKTTRSM